MNARARVLGWSFALAALVAAASCDKSGSTNTAGGQGGAPVDGAIVLRYKLGATKLQQRGTFDVNITGAGQFGEAVVRYTAALELVPAGDKLKVVWGLSEITGLETKGFYQAPAGDDTKAVMLAEAKGAFLVDARGRLDEAATEALAENAAKRERFEKLEAEATASGGEPKGSASMRILAMADSMVTLPDLPEAGLVVGKPVVVEEEEDITISGTVLPSESETKYTLVKIDESGSSRIAEIEIEVVTGGAAELPGGMITVEATTEGTMLFDIDGGFPVRYQITRSHTVAFGDNSLDSTTMIEATFDRV